MDETYKYLKPCTAPTMDRRSGQLATQEDKIKMTSWKDEKVRTAKECYNDLRDKPETLVSVSRL